jgi:hypothetical protein
MTTSFIKLVGRLWRPTILFGLHPHFLHRPSNQALPYLWAFKTISTPHAWPCWFLLGLLSLNVDKSISVSTWLVKNLCHIALNAENFWFTANCKLPVILIESRSCVQRAARATKFYVMMMMCLVLCIMSTLAQPGGLVIGQTAQLGSTLHCS